MRMPSLLMVAALLLAAATRAEEPPPAPKSDPAVEQIRAYAGISEEQAKKLLEKSSLIFVGRYRLGKYPCVWLDADNIAMPVAYNVTPTHILKGTFSCNVLDFDAENGKGVEHWPQRWIDDSSYLFFFSPSEASENTLRDPDGFFTERKRLSGDEQVAAYEIKDRKTASGRDWAEENLNLRDKTVANALETLGLNLKDAVRIDKPRNKVWKLQFPVEGERGTIHIRMTRKIFLPKGALDEQKVLDATVESVHFENDPPAKQEEKKPEQPAAPAP